MSQLPKFAPDTRSAIPIYLVQTAAAGSHAELVSQHEINWAKANGFEGESGQILLIPDGVGKVAKVIAGWPSDEDSNSQRFLFADILRKIPVGEYRLAAELTSDARDEAALAALFAQYTYDKYKRDPKKVARLAAPEGCDAARLQSVAAGEFLTRNLINTPARDMGPRGLANAAINLADRWGGRVETVTGEELRFGYPLIEAVGCAAAEQPRLVDLQWGDSGPKLTLIGKGVCFDTGGLNLKPGLSMALMKKDMGGAAVALGFAETVMRLGLRLRLRVLIPAVENSVSANAMRPGDVIRSRSGKTVEVTNTDAEGRLVMADAITRAEEQKPDILITLGTLTGAARVAMGPEIVPFFTENDAIANEIEQSASRVRDPVWRLPLWANYRKMLKSDAADIQNAPNSGFAGSITAALFLKAFVSRPDRWVHFDLYCWQPQSAPGLPKGGVGQAMRAVLDASDNLFKL